MNSEPMSIVEVEDERDKLANEVTELRSKLAIPREALEIADYSGSSVMDGFEDMCRRLSNIAHHALAKMDGEENE